MKIKLLGIDFEFGNGITMKDLFDHIAQQKGDPVELGGYGRFLYTAEHDGHHVGLLITTKNHNKFLEFRRDKMSAKLETRDVTEGSKLADFNFFAINKQTGRGIYQYYHHSCSLNTFGTLCKSHYETLKAQRVAAAKKQLGALKQSDEKAINKRFAGTLKWNAVVRKETFDKLVSQLKSIKAITVSLATLAHEETVFTPLAREAKKMIHRFTFARGTPVGHLVKGVRSFMKQADVETAKVEGVGEDGLDQVIKLINTPDFFGEFDFDSVADMMTITPNDFVSSTFLKQIIKAAKEAPALHNN